MAGILSIVDLLGKGATARPYASGQEVCPTETIEHDCDIYLRELLRATKIEDVEFRFPHRKNFRLPGIPENRAQDNVDVPYVFENFPSSVEEFKEE